MKIHLPYKCQLYICKSAASARDKLPLYHRHLQAQIAFAWRHLHPEAGQLLRATHGPRHCHDAGAELQSLGSCSLKFAESLGLIPVTGDDSGFNSSLLRIL